VGKILGASISQLGLKIIALATLICYFISKTILQRGIINLSQYNTDSLLAAMANGSVTMRIATYAILLQLLAGVSVTIYSFLLVEGFLKTEKYSLYLFNLLVFSLVAELPYDYALYGKTLFMGSQNPMFSLLIGLIMLYAFSLIQKDDSKHILLCLLVTLAGMGWCYILHVEFGVVTILLISIFYHFREYHGFRLFLGFIAGLPYVTGIFAIYPLYIYTGKRGRSYNKYIFYVLYPLILLFCALATAYVGEKSDAQINLPQKQEEAEIFVQKIDGIPEDFVKGMDVSSILSEEAAGVVYYTEAGKEEDVFKILAESGVNYARIRVWNDPYDKNGNGYGGGNNDVKTAGILGKRAADYGMKSCIDFHYSDFWADPSKQMAPKEWAHLRFEDKVDAIYDFTYDSLIQIHDSGAKIGMVQIGNEINHGLSGVTDFSQITQLLSSASKAVRAYEETSGEKVQIVVHYTEIDNPSNIIKIAGQLIDAGVDYDVFGVSFYRYWHGTMENMTALLTDITETYGKKTCVMETSYVYTNIDADGSANSVSGDEPVEGYPASVQGQANMIRDIMAAANEAGALGVFYWEGCWIAASNQYDTNKELYETTGAGWASSFAAKYDPNDAGKYYGGCSWDNQAMFSADGKALPSLSVFKFVNYGAVGKNLEIIAIPDLEIEVQKGTEVVMPDRVTAYYNDSSVTDGVIVSWNEEELGKINTQVAGNYTVSGLTENDQRVTAVIKVASINYVKNWSFEDSDVSMWKVSSRLSNDPTDIQNKAADAHSDNKAFHWWSNAKQDFTLEQIIEDLKSGSYYATAFAQGGDVGSDADIFLYVRIEHKDGEEEIYQEKIQLSGWVNWQNPEIRDIIVQDGDTAVIGINVSCAAKGWGTVDDIEFAIE